MNHSLFLEAFSCGLFWKILDHLVPDTHQQNVRVCVAEVTQEELNCVR